MVVALYILMLSTFTSSFSLFHMSTVFVKEVFSYIISCLLFPFNVVNSLYFEELFCVMIVSRKECKGGSRALPETSLLRAAEGFYPARHPSLSVEPSLAFLCLLMWVDPASDANSILGRTYAINIILSLSISMYCEIGSDADQNMICLHDASSGRMFSG